jgi:hypothetical protein
MKRSIRASGSSLQTRVERFSGSGNAEPVIGCATVKHGLGKKRIS